ncbi:MAG: hypothetical protein D6692_09315 [Planctomycetota bacterium]|nr:MAG: hypothetical protein D6692_09315 [Planctomycetota bacterium]
MRVGAHTHARAQTLAQRPITRNVRAVIHALITARSASMQHRSLARSASVLTPLSTIAHTHTQMHTHMLAVSACDHDQSAAHCALPM